MTQPPAGPRYGYLGPEGTFCEAALLAHLAGAGEPDAVRVPCGTVAAALDAVRSGEVDAAMVPVENSVEGSVSATVDELASGPALVIGSETLVPVTFDLLARPGTRLADVRRVATHPHAEAQCRGWLAANLPAAVALPASSTAGAAAVVAAPDAPYDAAIASPLAGQEYHLESLAHDIGDRPDAVTRFVLVSRPLPPAPLSGADKTSLVLTIGRDHPGALLEILTEFAVRGINLTRIESRPTGGGIGDYFFSVDVEGHVDEARVGEALIGLHRICAEVRYLGSYRRADRVAPVLRDGVSDAEYAQAQAWLARIRDGRA